MDNSDKNPPQSQMNPYTLDPPSAPIAEPMPPPMAPPVSYPDLKGFGANPTPYPQYPQAYPYPQAQAIASPTQVQLDMGKIRDWLPWSIVSIFVGGLIPGIIPLLFSIACRNNKKRNNLNGAKKMSNYALTSNILVTLFGIILTIALIVALVLWPNYFRREYTYRI